MNKLTTKKSGNIGNNTVVLEAFIGLDYITEKFPEWPEKRKAEFLDALCDKSYALADIIAKDFEDSLYQAGLRFRNDYIREPWEEVENISITIRLTRKAKKFYDKLSAFNNITVTKDCRSELEELFSAGLVTIDGICHFYNLPKSNIGIIVRKRFSYGEVTKCQTQ